MSVVPPSAPPPPAARPQDVVRRGPLCATCPTRTSGTACTDCRLRAGLHTASFPGPDVTILRRTPARWPVVTLLVCVFVVFVLGSVLTAVDRTTFGAASTVDDFFGALQQRDAAGATALLELGRGVPVPVSTPAMLRNAGYSPPKVWQIQDVKADFSSAVVTVRYLVDGNWTPMTLSLTRTGYRYGVFSRWKITPAGDGVAPLGWLPVVIPQETGVLVAGQKFGPEMSLRQSLALPGSYRLSVPANPIVALDRDRVVPSLQTRAAAVLPAKTAGADQAVQKAVDQMLKSCVKSHLAQPPGCPFGTTTSSYYCGDAGSFTWKVYQGGPLVFLAQPPELANLDVSAFSVSTRSPAGQQGYVTYLQSCAGGYPLQPGSSTVELEGWAVSVSGQAVQLIPRTGD